MRSLRFILVLVGAATLSACINSTTLIRVKPDGSGTVEQTTLINTQVLKAMMPGMSQTGKSSNAVNDADLKRTAERMGPGVRVVSAEPVTDNGFEGVKAIFSFDDINQVQISQDPDLGGGSGVRMPSDRTSKNPVTFGLERHGAVSVLTITVQDKPSSTVKPPDTRTMPDMSDPMMMGMIKSMFQGFKVNIGLEVIGSIVKTNAEYVSGPRLTLLEMDMGALLEDEAKFKALQSKLGPDASLSAVKPFLKDLKGIKIDGPVVTVEFR
jgi:hypothetical protein